jgi:hypothetical protein
MLARRPALPQQQQRMGGRPMDGDLDDFDINFDSESQSPEELWASLSPDERAEVEEQSARGGESTASWLDAYVRGERLLQRDVDDLDELWVAGQHAWDRIQQAHRELEGVLAEQVETDDDDEGGWTEDEEG